MLPCLATKNDSEQRTAVRLPGQHKSYNWSLSDWKFTTMVIKEKVSYQHLVIDLIKKPLRLTHLHSTLFPSKVALSSKTTSWISKHFDDFMTCNFWAISDLTLLWNTPYFGSWLLRGLKKETASSGSGCNSSVRSWEFFLPQWLLSKQEWVQAESRGKVSVAGRSKSRNLRTFDIFVRDVGTGISEILTLIRTHHGRQMCSSSTGPRKDKGRVKH